MPLFKITCIVWSGRGLGTWMAVWPNVIVFRFTDGNCSFTTVIRHAPPT